MAGINTFDIQVDGGGSTSAGAVVTGFVYPALGTTTANGVLYLNGSKVATSGSALVFDGTNFSTTGTATATKVIPTGNVTAGNGMYLPTTNTLAWSTNGAEGMRLDSSGNLGIGTTSPGAKLEVHGASRFRTATDVNISFSADSGSAQLYVVNNASSAYAPLQIGGSYLRFDTGGTERLRIDSSGNLGLGVTPSAWSSYTALQLGGGSLASYTDNAYIELMQNAYYNGSAYKYVNNGYASNFTQHNGAHYWLTAPSGTAGNTITFTQAMTLDASGNLLLGATSQPNGGVTRLSIRQTGGDLSSTTVTRANAQGITIADAASSTNNFGNGIWFDSGSLLAGIASTRITTSNWGTDLRFYTHPTTVSNADDTYERARITSDGNLLVGCTSFPGAGTTTTGAALGPSGTVSVFRAAATSTYIGRSNDGELVAFYSGATQQGSISVSGTTVSYNAFAGSHWSQLQDGSKPEILRGTVMESIDDLCEWPDEPQSERLCRVKISDTEGSKKVYGVFMDWDNDWTATNDMLVTSLGVFICRVNGSVEVQQGDLLESNGDGTARVQADDIIRSSTIGKVTSTVKTHEHPDGSYCVPTVLYCG